MSFYLRVTCFRHAITSALLCIGQEVTLGPDNCSLMVALDQKHGMFLCADHLFLLIQLSGILDD